MPPQRRQTSLKDFKSTTKLEATDRPSVNAEKKHLRVTREQLCNNASSIKENSVAPDEDHDNNFVMNRRGLSDRMDKNKTSHKEDERVNDLANSGTSRQDENVDFPELSPKRKRRRQKSLDPIEENTPEAEMRRSRPAGEAQPAAKSRRMSPELAKEVAGKMRADSGVHGGASSNEISRRKMESSGKSMSDMESMSDMCSLQPSMKQTATLSQQSIHTPTTFVSQSQGSIDTPPVGVSRLPSQNDGSGCRDSNRYHDDVAEHDTEMDQEKVNDDDDGRGGAVQAVPLNTADDTFWQSSGYGSSAYTPEDLPTPIPFPRSSLPSSFKLSYSNAVTTPRPVRPHHSHSYPSTDATKTTAKESLSQDGPGLHIGNHERGNYRKQDLPQTQERPGALFSDTPEEDGNDEKVKHQTHLEQDSLSKKRHTVDLGLVAGNSQAGKMSRRKVPVLLAGQTELQWNKKKKEDIGQSNEQHEIKEAQEKCASRSIWNDDEDLEEPKDLFGSASAVKTSPTMSSVADPIEEITQTDDDDNVERVDAKSSRGVQLLRAAAAASKAGVATTSSTTGSLFASAHVSSKSPTSSDLASPLFDPSACPAESIVHTPANKANKSSRFSVIASIFDQIEALKSSGAGSRKKTAILLTNLFRVLIWRIPVDLIPAIYFCLNKVAPDYEGLEVGVGESTLIKVMVDVYGRSEPSIKNDLKKHEDLGKVAELSRCSMKQLFKPPVLTIQSVFNALKALPTISGKNSQEQKKAAIKKLLTSAEKSEPKYIIRFLQGRMRVGVQAATVYQALAFAFALTFPQPTTLGPCSRSPCSDIRRASKKGMTQADVDSLLSQWEVAVRTALSEVSNVEMVTQKLFEGATAASLPNQCGVTAGNPVQPMLAKPTKGLQEVLQRFSDCDFTCEFKYDGERVQLHLLPNKSIILFSRNLENLTLKYPDIIKAARDALQSDVTECILDCEIVAYDLEKEKIQSFQMLSTRKRKGVETGNVTVQVCVMAFDCIQFNGQSLTKLPLEERREYLHNCITEVPNRFLFARHSEMTTLDEVDLFFQEAVDANCEGLMVKTLHKNASYEPSKRSLNWLKIKKDYMQHLTDSVDLVPIGAYCGRGKRSKWYGTYLLACYNPDEETYQTVCKVGTGFTEENLQEFHQFFKSRITNVKNPCYQVESKLEPDVWFEPSVVWEVRAADLSVSPLHTGGIGLKHPERGIGLRFPRFIRVRDDRKPETATTHIEIVDMYDNQFRESKGGAGKTLTKDDDNDDDDSDD